MIVLPKDNPRGIIWLASYPRSGNTWTRTFVHALVNVIANPDFQDLDLNRLDDFSAAESDNKLYEKYVGTPVWRALPAAIAAARPQVHADIVQQANRVVFVKTHNANALDHGVPIINMAVSLGGVYLVRNPLDVAISFAHFRGVPIDQVIMEMGNSQFGRGRDANNVHTLMGSWSDHVRSWTERKHPALLVIRYEDLAEKPIETFGEVAKHLLMNPTPEQLQRAIDLASFERLQKKEIEHGFKEKPSTSQLPFFREGRVGQWQEVLSPEQVDAVTSRHKTMMREFGYLPKNGG